MNPIKYLNGGLGLVASEKRNIRSGVEYNKYFSAPARQDKYLSYAGNTEDTIQFMSEIIKSTLADTKKIAPVLRGKDLRRTLSNIFNFVFSHMQYKPDDPANEELRRPKRAWADRVSGVDCDCYSIFIGSILSNLKIPFSLRMVKIGGRQYYQHVYVVVPKNGKQSGVTNRNSYYAVDPVLDTFNEEHPFTGKYDLFMNPIKYLNGPPSASLNGLQGDGMNELFYSPEAAAETRNDVIFFDGIDYYDRVNGIGGLNGLQGLNGLGFLRKIWGAVKKVGKVVKKIGGSAVKKIVHKKDGTKRGVFQLLSKKPTREAVPTALPSKGATPIIMPQNQLTPIGLPPATSVASSNNVTPQQMMDIAKNMDKSIGVDKILDIVKSVVPDNSLVAQIIDAKAQANKGISPLEARMYANDAAKANEAEITNNVMDQVYRMKQFENQPLQQQQTGFLSSPQNLLLLAALGIGVGSMVMSARKTA